MKRYRLKTFFVGMATAAMAMFGIAAPAGAVGVLYSCDMGTGYYFWTCTKIINGPVTVLDRSTNRNVTWNNGTSVALGAWDFDNSGKCGSHGDGYVWNVLWNNSHHAVIGDYFLNTHPTWYWQDYDNGNLYYNLHKTTFGHGYCNDPSWDGFYQ